MLSSDGKVKFALLYSSSSNSLLDIEFDRSALVANVDFD